MKKTLRDSRSKLAVWGSLFALSLCLLGATPASEQLKEDRQWFQEHVAVVDMKVLLEEHPDFQKNCGAGGTLNPFGSTDRGDSTQGA